MINKNHKLKIIISTSIIVITGISIFYFKSTISKENLIVKINKIYYSQFENEEYRSEFKEIMYKNYKILCNEESEIVLPLLFSYLDKMELEATEFFGYLPKSKLTIQLDFDKEIYIKRLSIGDPQRDSSGYYNSTLNTIYMNVEDVFREIIHNLPKIKENDDGSFIIQSMSFKERFFNLYYNYIIENFLKDNDLNKEVFPIWFISGLREYYSFMAEPIYEESVFLSLEQLNDSNIWIEYSESEENSNLFAQSTYLIHKIIQLNGKKSVNNIIEKCKTNTFEKSFNEVMRISLDEFENNVSTSYNIYDSEYYAISSTDINDYIDVKIQCLEEYIKNNESDIRAYEFLCTLYEVNSGFEKTVSFLKDSIEKYPEEAILWRRLAIVYENNNMIDLANECYAKEELLGDK